MTPLQLTTAIVVGLFFTILILVLVLNRKRMGSKSTTGTGKPKMSYGKIWNWVIPIGIISVLVIYGLIVPKHFKEGGNGSAIAKSALYSWKKKDHQYGFDPGQRFGGPYNAQITRNDSSHFCFTVFSPDGKKMAYFTGRKEDGGIIRGSGCWQNNPRGGRDGRDGGDFYLKMDSRDPRLYEGECTDSDLPDGVYIKLRITD